MLRLLVETLVATEGITTVDGKDYTSDSTVVVKFTFPRLFHMNAARDLTLTNGEFQSYYVRYPHQPISGSAEIIFKITPTNDGPVTLTLPAGKIQHGLDTSPALTYSFIYDTIAPSFSDAQTSYTIPFGDALPALTCTDVDHDSNSSTFDAVAPSFDSYALGTRDAIYTCTDPAGNSVSHTAAITVVPANNVTVKEFDVGDFGYHGDFKRFISFNVTLNEPLDLGLQGFFSGGSLCNSVFKTDIPDDPATTRATEGCIFLDNTIKAPNSELIIGYELTILRIPDNGPFTFTIPAGLGPETSGIRTAKQSHTFEYVTGQYITLTPSPVDVFTNAKPVIFNIKSDQYIKDIFSYGIISDNGPVTFARDSSDPENTKLIRLLASNLPFTNAFTITSNPASDGTVTLSVPSIPNSGPFGNSTKPLSFSYVYDTTDPTFAPFDSIYYVPSGDTSYDLPTIKCEDANTNGSFDADYVSGTVVTTNLNLQKVTYSCTDKAGNDATAEVSFQVSTVEPITATLTAPEFSNKRNVTIQIAFSEPVTGFHATQDVSATNGRVVGGTGASGASAYSVIVRPAADGLVTVTVRENSVTSGVKPFASAQITFTSDKTPPTFNGYSNLVNTNTINIGGAAPLPSITGLCVDANFSSNRDAVRGTTITVDTSTSGTYTNTYTCTDDAGNDSTLSVAYVVEALPPITVELRSGFSGHTKVNQYHFQIFFSEPVTSLQKTDFIVSGPHRTFLDLVHVSPYTRANLFFADIVHEGELIITLKAGSVQARDDGLATNSATSFTIIYDKTPPKIIYSGNDVTITQGDTFTPLTAVCRDNVDESRDIKSSSINTDTAGEFSVTFACSDRVGNVATPVSVAVTISAGPVPDNVPPQLVNPPYSIGYSIHRVIQNQLYVDPYFKCVDDVDGEFDATKSLVRYSSTVVDISSAVSVFNAPRTPLADRSLNVDTSVAVNTSYEVSYSCTDHNGNVSTERPYRVFVIIVSELTPMAHLYLDFATD